MFRKTISTSTSVSPSLHTCFCVCPIKLAPIPAEVSQNVSIKSCLVGVWSKNMHFWSPLKPLGSMRHGEAELQDGEAKFAGS